MPFARSGRADAVLFDKYPELAERIERGRRARIDAIVLSNKFAEGNGPVSSSFRAQSLEEISASPLRQRNRRRASRGSKVDEVESPATTPALKGKSSASDLMFEMSDGEDEEKLGARIQPPQFSRPSTQKHAASTRLESRDEPWVDVRRQSSLSLHDSGIEKAMHSLNTDSPQTKTANERTPGQPWGAAPLAAAKLDLKDIMAQTSSDKPSILTLGLSQQEKEKKAPGSFQAKVSQKERKRLQQNYQTGHPATIETPKPVPPTVSPWQAMSQRKSSSNTAITPTPQPSRATSTPQLTMRQTVANRGTTSKQKENEDTPQASRTMSGSARPSQNRPTSSSERGMSVSTTPIPTPHSVRHIPPPSHSPTSPSQHLSMTDILSSQQAEKDYVREAAAKRSLQEIQQEQEFQQWWDQESKRVMQEEEQRKRAENRAAKANRGRGKNRVGRGKGKSKDKKEGDEGDDRGKGSRDMGGVPVASQASESNTTSNHDRAENARPRGKGHRGGRGGGKGGRPQGPAKEGSNQAVTNTK